MWLEGAVGSVCACQKGLGPRVALVSLLVPQPITCVLSLSGGLPCCWHSCFLALGALDTPAFLTLLPYDCIGVRLTLLLFVKMLALFKRSLGLILKKKVKHFYGPLKCCGL